MRNLILYVFLTLTVIASAENRNKLDSLLRVKGSTDDTAAVKHFINICYAYKKVNPDSAVYWVNKAITLAKKIGDQKFIVLAVHSKGYHYRSIGENSMAIDTLLYAYQLSKESEKKTNLVGICQDIGVLYRILGNFDRSVSYFQEALKQAQLTNNKKGIYNSYNSLANTYCQMGMGKRAFNDLERALQFYDKALQFADSSNKSVISMIKGNSGVALFNMGIQKKDSSLLLRALDLYFESLKYRVALGDSIGISQSYGNIAGAYHELCNISPNEGYLRIAKRYYELGIDMGTKMGSNVVYHDVLNYGSHLGLMAKLKKDKVLAKMAAENLKKALMDAIKFGDIMNQMTANGSLASVYQELGQYDQAIHYLNRYVNLKDTILSEENKQVAEELATKYESELKEAENNNLKNAALLREEVISKKSTTINVMIIGSILMLGLIILVLISRQKITKAKHLTEKQKLIIEEKNKEITDSINYAKRLQNTMLPDEISLGTLFEDSFIFYRPKDIVSGDFYWYAENGNNKIIAAVDCTGHGVPGAFMSMLGITFLNEIVGQKNIFTPNLILGELRDRVKSTLKQRGIEGEARDGMDMALVNIDREKLTLQFSGANNPIWICRGQQIIELNPDKRPIGYFKGQRLPFTNHSVELKKGDRVYLFTDGYADQFGGPRGKKFKYKTLSDLLLNNNQKPCSEQKDILERTFVDWKGNLDQIDDVLVIGIKI